MFGLGFPYFSLGHEDLMKFITVKIDEKKQKRLTAPSLPALAEQILWAAFRKATSEKRRWSALFIRKPNRD